MNISGKRFFASEEEAKVALRAGDMVQAITPPPNFSDKSEDVEFYYQEEEEDSIGSGA
jgi:hypothetical protein